MLIFGTTGITSTKEDYQFFCPDCGPGSGHRKVVRRFFTLYFIPLIPLDIIQEYIECDRCRGAYTMEILQYDPAKAQTRQFCEDLKRMMILVMIADGTVDDAEIELIQQIYASLAGVELPRREIEHDVVLARQANIAAVNYARRIRPTLNEEQKAQIVKATFLVASAAGEMQQAQSLQLQQLADALAIPEEQYRRYIQETLES